MELFFSLVVFIGVIKGENMKNIIHSPNFSKTIKQEVIKKDIINKPQRCDKIKFVEIENNKKTILALLKAEKEKSTPRTTTMTIKGNLKTLYVIKLNLKNAYLNHDNNRISTQLDDMGQDANEIRSNPNSSISQDKIAQLLSETPEFSKLMEEIEDDGQQEPGLITNDGKLVNGNTRYVALKKLKENGRDFGGIDVAVLEEGTDLDDIMQYELALQFRTYTLQKYSYVNQLRTYEKYLKMNDNSYKDLASKIGWKRNGEKKVKQCMRILDLINEARKKSNFKLKYAQFDNNEEALKNLDETYNSIKVNFGEAQANEVKNLRLLAILQGVNKDGVRAIDQDFLEQLTDRAENNNNLKDFFNKYTEKKIIDSDLADDDDDDDSETILNTHKLLDDFLEDDNNIHEGLISNQINDSYAELKEEIENESDRQISLSRLEQRRRGLHDALKNAQKDLSDIRKALHDRIGMQGFDKNAFEIALKNVRKEIERLDKEFKEQKEE